jgi:hypothetical protein
MTPQEKAIELADKFYKDDLLFWEINMIQAIQCALITVDELLEDKVEIDGMRVINDSYWMEVKQELLNLKNK